MVPGITGRLLLIGRVFFALFKYLNEKPSQSHQNQRIQVPSLLVLFVTAPNSRKNLPDSPWFTNLVEFTDFPENINM